MKPFRERNPVIIGALSIVTIVLLITAAMRAQDLPLIGGGDTYYANFTEAGGLATGDEVRIAGVRVGKINSIELQGDQVHVGFKIKTDARLGAQTKAAIQVKTILGSMYLALEPQGGGTLAKDATIPTSRTSSPYNVVDAFTGLAKTSGKIDTNQLASSLTTLANLTRNTPQSFQRALRGVSALSQVVASRDEQVNHLLKSLDRVSTVLDARDQDIVSLMHASGTLFNALLKRRVAIHNLLKATVTLSTQLTGLVRDSRADLKPALTHLANVVDILNKNEDNVDNSLRLMAPFYRVFASTLGNGPWFDSYIYNLPPIPGLKGGLS
ncbi:MAG: MCE family protein [Nocardioidaceae bacterium]|nr:MCE family protein [Nocardioidaceae bacterium]MCL2614575.1 MCE family protein [Nocardioidaceae bacterium]